MYLKVKDTFIPKLMQGDEAEFQTFQKFGKLTQLWNVNAT